jgi:hypothetical protein
MAQDYRGIGGSSSVEKQSAHAASFRRMKLHRQRRRLGLRCATVPLREGQIEGLIHRGWLPRAERANRVAIEKALLLYLADNLGSRATR